MPAAPPVPAAPPASRTDEDETLTEEKRAELADNESHLEEVCLLI